MAPSGISSWKYPRQQGPANDDGLTQFQPNSVSELNKWGKWGKWGITADPDMANGVDYVRIRTPRRHCLYTAAGPPNSPFPPFRAPLPHSYPIHCSAAVGSACSLGGK